jgi:hypothetical protein
MGGTGRARGLRPDASEREQLVDAPVIVGMLTVLAGEHSPVWSDQKVRGQPEATAFGAERGHRRSVREDFTQRVGDGSCDGRPHARREQCAQSTFDTEAFIETLVRVRDDRERQMTGIALQLCAARVKDRDFVDLGRDELIMALCEGVEMQVAHWAACEAPELQMDQTRARPDLHERSRDRVESPPREHVPDADPAS